MGYRVWMRINIRPQMETNINKKLAITYTKYWNEVICHLLLVIVETIQLIHSIYFKFKSF